MDHKLAGIIGTGLFLGLGQVLSLTGPLGSLLIYIHVSTVVYACVVPASSSLPLHNLIQYDIICRGDDSLRAHIWIIIFLW